MNKLMMAAVLIAGGFAGPALAADKDLPLPTDDKFLVKSVECLVAEIKFADTMISRSSNAEVKAFAQKLKNEHGDCLKRLMNLAAQRKLAVVEGLDPEHREIASRLSKLEGKALDEEYLRGVIERHEKAISMMEKQDKEGKVAEINTVAKDSLPKLKEHLQEARTLQTKLKG